jgi:hypothetical protein
VSVCISSFLYGETKMNRLRKLADEQLSLDFDEKINSFDDYQILHY